MEPDSTVPVEAVFWNELADVVVVASLLALCALLAWLVYRSMSDPRLPVIREPGSPPRVSWGGAARYILTAPPMMLFWYVVMLVLLVIATRGRTSLEISAALAAIIGGTRILAHVNSDVAHEVAKIVPLVLLSILLIGGNLADEEQLSRIGAEMEDVLPVFGMDMVALLVFEYCVTAIWLLRQRWVYARAQRRIAAGKPVAGPLRRAWIRWKGIGYAPDAATEPEPGRIAP